MANAATADPEVSDAPELIIGLVGAVGTDLRMVTDALVSALDDFAYRAEVIQLSELLHEMDWERDLPGKPIDEHISTHMDAGDELRESWGNGDALALLCLSEIADRREKLGSPSRPVPRTAYILRSFKHPKEIERVRSVYGGRFLLLAAYSPREERAHLLSERIAADHHSMQPTDYLDDAYRLMQRDEAEDDRPLGQNVRDTFHLADVFLDARDRQSLDPAIDRAMEIIFGHPFRTPSRDEHAMFLAQAAAMRSAEMGRQVGAVIATEEGDIVAVGANEVPRYGGGLYWEGDPGDARDFHSGEDSSDVMKHRLVGELLVRLAEQDWIAAEKKESSAGDLYEVMKGTRVASLIEFGRAVHAEMAALMDAARRGVAVDKCTLYTSTFPCHGCARHVVAAGIKRVVYIAPYSKSLAETLHDDSIDVDPRKPRSDAVSFMPFVGIAPRSYLDLFSMKSRKDRQTGRAVELSRRTAIPRPVESEPDTPIPPYLAAEEVALDVLKRATENSDLKLKTET
jgi:deoxycytidylate deaminase